jgi:hypothetical protein
MQLLLVAAHQAQPVADGCSAKDPRHDLSETGAEESIAEGALRLPRKRISIENHSAPHERRPAGVPIEELGESRHVDVSFDIIADGGYDAVCGGVLVAVVHPLPRFSQRPTLRGWHRQFVEGAVDHEDGRITRVHVGRNRCSREDIGGAARRPVDRTAEEGSRHGLGRRVVRDRERGKVSDPCEIDDRGD